MKTQQTKEPEDPILWDAQPNDLVIPIMGPPGVGKSTFVNRLCGTDTMKVGHDLQTCTTELKAAVVQPRQGPFEKHRLVIVDTPPFNGNAIPDYEILRRVAVWLALSYEKGTKVAGVVYLLDSSQTLGSWQELRDLRILTKLCGGKALGVIVVGMTNRWHLEEQTLEAWKDELRNWFYHETQEKLHICEVNFEDAWNVINQLADDKEKGVILQIQRELVENKKDIEETEVWRCVAGGRQRHNAYYLIERFLFSLNKWYRERLRDSLGTSVELEPYPTQAA